MGTNNICLNCGNTSFVSDRSLGGRIVCSKCGSSSFRKRTFSKFSKKIFLFSVGLVVLLLIII